MARRIDESLVRKMIEMRDNGYSTRIIADKFGRSHSGVGYLLSVYAIADGELVRIPNHMEVSGKSWTHPIHTALRTHGSVTIEDGMNDGYIATVGEQWTGREAKSVHQAIISALVAASEAV